MARPKHAMEIFALLDKSNCGECGETTCLAFAGAVFQGRKGIDRCPRLTPETISHYGHGAKRPNIVDEEREAYLEKLKGEIVDIDLREAAERTGGRFSGDKLTIRVLGKDFRVDTGGKLYADIHVNPWVAIPFLTYVLHSNGLALSGNWVSFRELHNGRERYPLFKQRCEEAMKQLADQYTDFFDDIIHMFSGKKVGAHFESDISVVLSPLPRVPIMICYWKPDEGMASSLNLFFDDTADQNLDIGSVFSLGVGLAQMFGKLALRHGFRNSDAPAEGPVRE